MGVGSCGMTSKKGSVVCACCAWPRNFHAHRSLTLPKSEAQTTDKRHDAAMPREAPGMPSACSNVRVRAASLSAEASGAIEHCSTDAKSPLASTRLMHVWRSMFDIENHFQIEVKRQIRLAM